MFFIIQLLIVSVFLIVISSLFVYFLIDLMVLLQGASYVATNSKKIEKIIKLAVVKPGEKVADLGSGDGRIVIALAQAGLEAHGYEINPFLVWLAKRKIRKARLVGKAFIHRQDFWNKNFNDFDIVTIFGIPHILKRLEKKLKNELKPGARVISVSFGFPNWPVNKKENNLYLYKNL